MATKDAIDKMIEELSLPKDYTNYIFVYAIPQPTPIISFYYIKGSPFKLWTDKLYYVLNPGNIIYDPITAILKAYPVNKLLVRYINENIDKLKKGNKYAMNNLIHLHLTRLPQYTRGESYFYFDPLTDSDITLKFFKAQYNLDEKVRKALLHTLISNADDRKVKKVNVNLTFKEKQYYI